MKFSLIYFSFLIFFIKLLFHVLLNRIFYFKFNNLGFILFYYGFVPFLIFLINLRLHILEYETIFLYANLSFVFIISYPALEINNIPSLNIVYIIYVAKKKNLKCNYNKIKSSLKPNKIINKRIESLNKDRFIIYKKNQIYLSLFGVLFAKFFSILRILFKIKKTSG